MQKSYHDIKIGQLFRYRNGDINVVLDVLTGLDPDYSKWGFDFGVEEISDGDIVVVHYSYEHKEMMLSYDHYYKKYAQLL